MIINNADFVMFERLYNIIGDSGRDLQLRNLSFKEAYTMKLKKKSVNIS